MSTLEAALDASIRERVLEREPLVLAFALSGPEARAALEALGALAAGTLGLSAQAPSERARLGRVPAVAEAARRLEAAVPRVLAASLELYALARRRPDDFAASVAGTRAGWAHVRALLAIVAAVRVAADATEPAALVAALEEALGWARRAAATDAAAAMRAEAAAVPPTLVPRGIRVGAEPPGVFARTKSAFTYLFWLLASIIAVFVVSTNALKQLRGLLTLSTAASIAGLSIIFATATAPTDAPNLVQVYLTGYTSANGSVVMSHTASVLARTSLAAVKVFSQRSSAVLLANAGDRPYATLATAALVASTLMYFVVTRLRAAAPNGVRAPSSQLGAAVEQLRSEVEPRLERLEAVVSTLARQLAASERAASERADATAARDAASAARLDALLDSVTALTSARERGVLEALGGAGSSSQLTLAVAAALEQGAASALERALRENRSMRTDVTEYAIRRELVDAVSVDRLNTLLQGTLLNNVRLGKVLDGLEELVALVDDAPAAERPLFPSFTLAARDELDVLGDEDLALAKPDRSPPTVLERNDAARAIVERRARERRARAGGQGDLLTPEELAAFRRRELALRDEQGRLLSWDFDLSVPSEANGGSSGATLADGSLRAGALLSAPLLRGVRVQLRLEGDGSEAEQAAVREYLRSSRQRVCGAGITPEYEREVLEDERYTKVVARLAKVPGESYTRARLFDAWPAAARELFRSFSSTATRGTVVGFLAYNAVQLDVLELVCVNPTFATLGLGRLLLRHWEERATTAPGHGGELVLASVTSEEALGFYKRAGYTDVAPERFVSPRRDYVELRGTSGGLGRRGRLLVFTVPGTVVMSRRTRPETIVVASDEEEEDEDDEGALLTCATRSGAPLDAIPDAYAALKDAMRARGVLELPDHEDGARTIVYVPAEGETQLAGLGDYFEGGDSGVPGLVLRVHAADEAEIVFPRPLRDVTARLDADGQLHVRVYRDTSFVYEFFYVVGSGEPLADGDVVLVHARVRPGVSYRFPDSAAQAAGSYRNAATHTGVRPRSMDDDWGRAYLALDGLLQGRAVLAAGSADAVFAALEAAASPLLTRFLAWRHAIDIGTLARAIDVEPEHGNDGRIEAVIVWAAALIRAVPARAIINPSITGEAPDADAMALLQASARADSAAGVQLALSLFTSSKPDLLRDALQDASELGNVAVVRALLAAGAPAHVGRAITAFDTRSRDGQSTTGLYKALRAHAWPASTAATAHGNVEALRVLLAAPGLDMQDAAILRFAFVGVGTDAASGGTYRRAIARREPALVRELVLALLDAGVNAARDNYRVLALAIRSGNAALVRALLARADFAGVVEQRITDGDSWDELFVYVPRFPLAIAFVALPPGEAPAHMDIVRALLAAGASLAETLESAPLLKRIARAVLELEETREQAAARVYALRAVIDSAEWQRAYDMLLVWTTWHAIPRATKRALLVDVLAGFRTVAVRYSSNNTPLPREQLDLVHELLRAMLIVLEYVDTGSALLERVIRMPQVPTWWRLNVARVIVTANGAAFDVSDYDNVLSQALAQQDGDMALLLLRAGATLAAGTRLFAGASEELKAAAAASRRRVKRVRANARSVVPALMPSACDGWAARDTRHDDGVPVDDDDDADVDDDDNDDA